MSDDLAPCRIGRPLHDPAELPPLVPEVFVSSPFPRAFPSAVHPPTSFDPPPEFHEPEPTACRFRLGGPFHEVSRLIAPSTPRVRRHDGFQPPPPSALRFLQPLGGLLPKTPCGLVSSRWHVQASPSGGFPLQEPLRLIAAALPSCRYRDRGSPCEATHPWPDFRALLPWRIRCDRSAVKRAVRPIPSWASPSPGPASPRSVGHASAALPSRASLTPVRDGCFGAPQGLTGPEDGPSLARRPALLRFLASSIPPTFGRAPDLAYRFASAGMPRHRVTTHLFGPSPSPTAATGAIVFGPTLF